MRFLKKRQVLLLRPEEIIVSPENQRRKTDMLFIKKLSENIAVNGIIEPLIVRKTENARYELVCGHSRLKAAIECGLRRVPCVIKRLDRKGGFLLNISENIYKSQNTYFDEARMIDILISRYSVSQNEIAARLGITKLDLQDKLMLLRLTPQIQEIITNHSLPREYAYLLLKLPPEKRLEAIEKIIEARMPFHIALKFVDAYFDYENTSGKIEKEPLRKTVIGDLRLFSNSLIKLVESAKEGGIRADLSRYETDNYMEYRVKIKKDKKSKEYAEQLKIC